MEHTTVPAGPREFEQWCTEQGIRTVVTGSGDVHGLWRGKRLTVPQLLRQVERGIAFSDVLFVLPHDESVAVEPPGGGEHPTYFPRKEQGYPDIFLRPDLSTARRLPWHPGTAGILGDFTLVDGGPVPIAPRQLVRRLVDRARGHGLQPVVAVEYEFFVLTGGLSELIAAGYRPTPLYERPYTYSVYRSSLHQELLASICAHMEKCGIDVVAYTSETGPGQFELNIAHRDALTAADDAFLFKNGVKEIAGQAGLLASFMAKLSQEWAGSSGHLHLSLADVDNGENVCHDDAGEHGLSEVARHAVAGMLTTMREMTALFCPTPNSYKRLTPYSWAPVNVTWGLDNRSTGLRVVGEHPEDTRVEHRLPGADANPYLAIAAAVAGAVHGVERKLDLTEPLRADAYAVDGQEPLPRSLDEALDLFEQSTTAREMFGDDAVDFFVVMKRHECDQYRLQVSEWEVRQYVELG